MEKKKDHHIDSEPFDYFKDENADQTEETTQPDNVVNALRSDMVPGSWATPAKKNIFQLISIKVMLGVLIGLVLFGLIWYFGFGTGRSMLEQKLASLVLREVTATQTLEPTQMPTTEIPPTPTKTPHRTATIRATNTPFLVSATETPIRTPITLATNTPLLAFATSTITTQTTQSPIPSGECRDALSITLADVGKTLCVQGVVIRTKEKPNNFTAAFGNEAGAFYLVTYDLVWSKAELGTCYRIYGTISQIANSPVLLFNYNNLPEVCP